MATVYGVTYDSFSMHDEVYRTLRQQLGTLLENLRTGEAGEARNGLALAGTSLGGYWAARFGNHFGIPAVLINPTIHPHQSLKRYVGHKLLNFVTRSRNILRDEVPASYGDIERSGHFLVLLDKGDEVLDYRVTEQWFASGKISGSSHPAQPETPAPETVRRDCCKVVTFEGGSHRFSHMDEALPHIRQFLSRYFPSRQHPSGQHSSEKSPSGQSSSGQSSSGQSLSGQSPPR